MAGVENQVFVIEGRPTYTPEEYACACIQGVEYHVPYRRTASCAVVND